MRARDSKRLVIDTDVAQASGGEDAIDSRAINCRDFLSEVRSLNYRVVMTKEISDEWKRHRFGFAFEWRVSMYARRRVDSIDPPEDQTLHNKITTTIKDEIEVIEKDFHLLNAALATDQKIISCEKQIRKLFARASKQVGEIQGIVWVNPERIVEEQPIEWLKNGAPPEEYRRLLNFIPY